MVVRQQSRPGGFFCATCKLQCRSDRPVSLSFLTVPRAGPKLGRMDWAPGTEAEANPGSTRTWFAPTLHLQATDKTWNAALNLAARSWGRR